MIGLPIPVSRGNATQVGLELSPGVTVFWGTGSPEAVVAANVGSWYLRLDGAPGATLYVKESGASQTGWVAK